MAGRLSKLSKSKAPIPQPVNQTTVVTQAAGIDARMIGILGLPVDVTQAILTTAYGVGDGPNRIEMPIFAIGRSALNPNDWVYNKQEIQEAIRVYDLMKGQYIATGGEGDPVTAPYSTAPADLTKIVSDSVASELFRQYLGQIALSKELKTKKDLLIHDDSVFEAPALEAARAEEIMKVNLMNRKRIPVKGECRRGGCKSNEIYLEEFFTRAGDEGGVWHHTCAKCGHIWKS